jgi:hypothetical protein
MKQGLTGIDYIDRYNFQKGKIDHLPNDESGINNFLMDRKKKIEKGKMVIDEKELKIFEEEVAEDIVKEIEKLLK